MKKYSLLLLFTAFHLFVIAQNKTDKEPIQTKLLSADVIKEVQVKTSGGSITVSGVPVSEARIEVYVSSNISKNELTKEAILQRLHDKYDLDISVIKNKLTATAKPKEKMNWKNSINISFEVFVPSNINTDLVTSGGSINLSNLSGDLDFSTSGGSLHLDNVSGKIDGRTSGGSIQVQNSKDDINLTTSGGSIEAKNCNGKLKLSTSGGSLSLIDLKGEINASTSGGNVKGSSVEGELKAATSGGNIDLNDLSCSIETSTSGGNINVSIAKLGKYVKIGNSSGNITVTLPKNQGLDLDLTGKIDNTYFENFSGTIDKYKVSGKLNGGGIPVSVDAGSGRIYFEQK